MYDYSAQFLQNIINNLPQYIFWKDRESRFLGCNLKFAQLLGLTCPQEIIGKTDYDLSWNKQESDKFVRDDKSVIESGKPKLFYEETQRQPDGKVHIVQVSKIPLYDNHQIIGLICIYEDITERKELEALRLEHSKNMEEKAAFLRKIAGTIAHDLRTPLASIRLAMQGVEKISEQFAVDHEIAVEHGLAEPIRPARMEAYKTALERAQREVLFANHYIDMSLGNLKYDQIDDSHYQTFTINSIIENSLQSYPFVDEEERQKVHWQQGMDFSFWGSEWYLKSVLNNLMKNALYQIKKARRGEITIWTETQGDENQLHIKDTAAGASKDVIEHMFDGFYSLNESGTGLGLAFCKAIMTSFKGDIWAESVLGEYMHFTLFFPRKMPD